MSLYQYQMHLKPSDIYFSQDTINNCFRQSSLHCGIQIGETLDDLCEGRCSIINIPTITVVKLGGKWITSDNRRLWVFRQLERLGKCDKIPVDQGYYIPDNKLTSINGGISIDVRRNPGGRWYLKPSAQKATVPSPTLSRTDDYSSNVLSLFGRLHVDTTSKQREGLETVSPVRAYSTHAPSVSRAIPSSFMSTRHEPTRYETVINQSYRSQETFRSPSSVQRHQQDSSVLVNRGEGRLLVAAIDLGTTNSGYAFSFRSDFLKDPSKIITNQWGTGAGTSVSFKAPTCVLFTPCQQFDSFGFEAQEKYVQLATEGTHYDWFFFKHFKMLLYENKNLNRYTVLRDDKDLTIPAKKVFAECIKYLRGHLVQTIKQRNAGVRDDEIHWVLTVPAIWNESAKQFMREAAVESGIGSDCLSLALEPEAASIFGQYKPEIANEDEDAPRNRLSLRTGTKYIVLDAGGGTVDITVHEILRDHKIKELYKANGGPMGGTKIDEAFLSLLADIFGEETMDEFKNSYCEDYLELLRDFETKKAHISPDLDQRFNFKIPSSIREAYIATTGQKFSANSLRVDLRKDVTFVMDKLRVHPSVAKNLFYATTSNLKAHLVDIFREPVLQGVDIIVMVGGFSESKMLQDEIKKTFPSKQIVVPDEAGLAVVKGAVMFGHSPETIITRVSRFTYGIRAMRPFDPFLHPSSKRVMINGEYRCNDCFDEHVIIGQEVQVGKPMNEIKYRPSSKTLTTFNVDIYKTAKKNPKYTDEEGVFEVGKIKMELSVVDCYENRSFGVRMIFGDTELGVEGRVVTTGQKVKASFNFLE